MILSAPQLLSGDGALCAQQLQTKPTITVVPIVFESRLFLSVMFSSTSMACEVESGKAHDIPQSPIMDELWPSSTEEPRKNQVDANRSMHLVCMLVLLLISQLPKGGKYYNHTDQLVRKEIDAKQTPRRPSTIYLVFTTSAAGSFCLDSQRTPGHLRA